MPELTNLNEIFPPKFSRDKCPEFISEVKNDFIRCIVYAESHAKRRLYLVLSLRCESVHPVISLDLFSLFLNKLLPYFLVANKNRSIFRCWNVLIMIMQTPDKDLTLSRNFMESSL